MKDLVAPVKPIRWDVKSAAFVDFFPCESCNFGVMDTKQRSFGVGVGSCLRDFIHSELFEDMEHVWGVLSVVVIVGGGTIGEVA